MASYIAFKLTGNDIIALELRKNMDIDKVLRLAFGLELIYLCKNKMKKQWNCVGMFRRTM